MYSSSVFCFYHSAWIRLLDVSVYLASKSLSIITVIPLMSNNQKGQWISAVASYIISCSLWSIPDKLNITPEWRLTPCFIDPLGLSTERVKIYIVCVLLSIHTVICMLCQSMTMTCNTRSTSDNTSGSSTCVSSVYSVPYHTQPSLYGWGYIVSQSTSVTLTCVIPADLELTQRMAWPTYYCVCLGASVMQVVCLPRHW